MPEFVNPFSGMAPDRKLNKREITRAIRLSIAAEYEAIHLYEAIADATDDPLTKEVMQDVANEEREHAGEIMRLLDFFLPDERQFLQNGYEEVEEEARKLGQTPEQTPSAEEPEGDVPSVGEMKSKG